MSSEYPGNSKTTKSAPALPDAPEDNKGITSMIDGEARLVKPSGFRRLRRSFIGGDATSVTEHIVWNLLIPAAKDTVADMGATFIDMMIFGQRRSVRGVSPGSHMVPTQNGVPSRYNYNGITNGGGSPLVLGQNSAPQEDFAPRTSPSQVVVPTRNDAERIAAKMQEIINQYTAVSVADLYRMVNRSPNYMDDKWGWTSIEGANLKRVGDGVLLDLPEPKDIS
jgi:hypothetical protein